MANRAHSRLFRGHAAVTGWSTLAEDELTRSQRSQRRTRLCLYSVYCVTRTPRPVRLVACLRTIEVSGPRQGIMSHAMAPLPAARCR